MGNHLQNILPGLSQMTNIHPLVVHFPIALLNSFVVMEILGVILNRDDLTGAATWMLYLGTLGAAAAVSAGLWAASTVPHTDEVHDIIERHEHFGLTVLSMAVVLSAWRIFFRARFSPKARAAHIFLAIVTVVTMAFGADLGGLMVYKYGVAVKAVPVPAGHDHGAATHDGGEEGHSHEDHDGHDHNHEMQHKD